MGKKHMFLGEVGAGANMKLVNTTLPITMLSSYVFRFKLID